MLLIVCYTFRLYSRMKLICRPVETSFHGSMWRGNHSAGHNSLIAIRKTLENTFSNAIPIFFHSNNIEEGYRVITLSGKIHDASKLARKISNNRRQTC